MLPGALLLTLSARAFLPDCRRREIHGGTQSESENRNDQEA